MTDLFFSFGNQHPGQLVLNNFPRFMQELSIPGNPVFDMGAVDILRARERGVPRYNEFRRQLGLNPIRTFDDLTDDEEHRRDAHGGLRRQRREPRPAGRHAWPRAPAADQLRLRRDDVPDLHPQRQPAAAGRPLLHRRLPRRRCTPRRAWSGSTTPASRPSSSATIPELAATGLGNVTNAFEPWDTDTWLDPLRHPLRAYQPELKRDPWLGDAHRPAR